MRRVCGLLGLLLAGCMPLGYAYPTVSYVRPATVGAAREEVRAFRIDVSDDDFCFEIPEKDRYVLTPLPLHPDGSFDPQMRVSADYGFMLNCFAWISGASTHHTVMVRLYRQGYHTIELESWRKDEPLSWTPAQTPFEREKAIDDLVSTWWTSPARLQSQYSSEGFVPPNEPIVFHYLAPGSTSQEHQTALVFAAEEYERLASEVANEELRSRLEDKAKALRQLVSR
jgi:hypothetical protein